MASLRSLGFSAHLPTAAVVIAAASSSSFKLRQKVQIRVSFGNFVGASNKGEVYNRSRRSLPGLKKLVGGMGVGGGILRSQFPVMAVPEASVATATEDEKTEGEKTVGASLPDLMTEFMVDMKCEGCVNSVRSKVESLGGVKSVDIDLANQIVRILGSASVKSLTTAIEQSGRTARLIGQGLPANFAISAAVAEFKGPQIYGVVRFAQVSMELTRFEASFSGLTPGCHSWSINTYGDLTEGAASTGDIYNPVSSQPATPKTEPLGDMGVLEVNSNGTVEISGTKSVLQVSDLIGRAVVVYENDRKSKKGSAAAVIARSAGVGENYKKLCACDGTIIWQSTNNDFAKL